MKKYNWLIVLLLIFLFLTSCANLAQDVNSIPTTNMSPTVVKPSTTETPMPDIVSESSFLIKDIIPPNRVVELGEMDIASETRLLVFDTTSKEILSISKRSVSKIIETQSGAEIQFHGIQFSPDKQWFAYLVIENGFNIWISSVDGEKQYLAIENAISSSFRWLNNGKILIDKKMGSWYDCPTQMQVYDPITQIIKDIPQIDTSNEKYCFPIPVFNSDFSKALFLTDDSWKIYNFSDKKAFSVLPNINTNISNDKYYIYWDSNDISYAIPSKNKIEYGIDIPIDNITNYGLKSSIYLPENTINENSSFDIQNEIIGVFGLDLKDKNGKNIFNCDINQTYVLINLQTKILRNYCLDRNNYNNQIGENWYSYLSADNRFIGWTIRDFESRSKPLATAILDIDTGRVSYLEGYEFLGFGEILK